MAIEIVKDEPVRVTESEFRRYRDEYHRAYMHYAGVAPSLEDYIRRRRVEEKEARRDYEALLNSL